MFEAEAKASRPRPKFCLRGHFGLEDLTSLVIVSEPDKFCRTYSNCRYESVKMFAVELRWGAVELHTVLMVWSCRCVKFCDSTFYSVCVGMGCVSKLCALCSWLGYVVDPMVHHHAKFNSSNYNDWSVEIYDMKKLLGLWEGPHTLF